MKLICEMCRSWRESDEFPRHLGRIGRCVNRKRIKIYGPYYTTENFECDEFKKRIIKKDNFYGKSN
jgi:hypothetical protein